MKTGLVLVMVGVFFHQNLALAADEEETEGYLQASQVKLRSEPNADSVVVGRLRIGAPIRWSPTADPVWCKVNTPDFGMKGFTHCEFLGKQRPTIEKLIEMFQKADPTKKAFRDVLLRLLLLSPSHHTVNEAIRFCSYGNDWRSCRKDFCDFFQVLAGVRIGADLRPIVKMWNVEMWNAKYKEKSFKTYETPHKPFAAPPFPVPIDDNYFGDVYAGDSERRKIKAEPSLFRSRDDLFLLPGGPLLKRMRSRKGPFRGPDGNAEVRYRTTEYSRPVGLLEYTKLLKDAPAVLRLLANKKGYECSVMLPTIVATFPDRPSVYILTRNGKLTSGTLVEVQEGNDSPCYLAYENVRDYAEVATRKPVEIAAVIITPNPLPIVNPTIKSIGHGSYAVDLDEDKRIDFAYIHMADECDGYVNSGCCYGKLIVNIGGKWHEAMLMCGIVCT